MKPRDYVLEQIHHHETHPVPYRLVFEGEVGNDLDEYYGGPEWRERITQYMLRVSAVATDNKQAISDTHWRDDYGGIWRQDRRPSHLETPPLAEPAFDGYEMPAPETFFRPEWKEDARKACEENSGEKFIITHLSWGLFERSWTMRGFENALMDAVAEPDFYEELLERLMNLYLAFVEYALDLPVDAIMFGDDWGDKIAFSGCLGSQSTVHFASPQEIGKEVARLCREVGAGGGYILAPAKCLQLGTPVENAAAVVEAFTQQE